MQVNDLGPFAKSLDASGSKYLRETEDGVDCLYMQVPGGLIFEFVKGPETTVFPPQHNVTVWD